MKKYNSLIRWGKYTSLFFLVIILYAVSNFAITAYRFNTKKSLLTLESKSQVWAHRGRHDKFPENSMAAFKHAFESGACGIELDVHFDIKMNRFVVSHDYPYQKIDGKLLSLESVFKQFGKSGFYWVDFKKLKIDNLNPSIVRMKYLLKKYDLQKYVFVESLKSELISKISQSGIQSIYWMKINTPKKSLKYFQNMHYFHKITADSNFSAISAPFKIAEYIGFDNYGQFPLFLFTVNDPQKMAYYKSLPNVQVILTDNPSLY